MNLAHTQCILVTGAAGFIGKDLVVRLLKHGWFVRAMVRKTSPVSFPKDERLQVVLADMRHAESLQAVMKDVAVVIHLAARKADEEDSEDVNVEGAKRLVEACQKAGCARIINLSTQSVKIPHKGTYARTKSDADHVFQRSGLAVTTLLPSIVYGEEKSGVFGAVLRVVQRFPVVPVLGNGQWRSAPVYVGDVSEAVIACITHDNTIGKMYDLGGPELISFDQLIDALCSELGVKRLKLHVPFQLSLAAAKILAKLLSPSPITVSNVLGSNQSTPIDISAARSDFAFAPMHLDRGLKAVMAKEPRPWAADIADQTHSKDQAWATVALAEESAVISVYLLGSKPPKEVIDRYIAAHRILFGEETPERLAPEVRYIRRHPSVLPFVDAAAGLLRPASPVRKKIFLMVAILEATPTYAEFFLSEPDSLLKLLCDLVWQGLRTVATLSIGIPIFLRARRWP